MTTTRVDAPSRFGLPLRPLGLAASAALFGGGALLLALATRVVIPALVSATGAEPVVMWFVAASTVVFAPLLLVAALLLRRERSAAVEPWSWRARLRLRAMNGADWAWSLAGLLAVSASTGGLAGALAMLGQRRLQPAFMAFAPLTAGRYWILAAWLPFFALNILGEEFVWRGVVLPRQEAAFGRAAWLVNGVLWLLFHAAFPWQVLVMLVPIALILPAIAQRRRSTWPGVVIHAVFGGIGFLALAFGLA
ncbi:MAG TPA: CPBP family intramembrane glutamic endopeptidase [Vicinamibacteria bacterium]